MSKIIFTCVCLVALTQLGWSQNGNQGTLFGGRSSAKVQSATASPDITTTEVFGIWNVALTLVVTTTPASGDIVACSATLDVEGYEEKGVAIASISGTSGSCTVVIPYQWYLVAPTTDQVSISYKVDIFHAYTIGGTTLVEQSRETFDVIPTTVPVPPDFAHTTTSATARI